MLWKYVLNNNQQSLKVLEERKFNFLLNIFFIQVRNSELFDSAEHMCNDFEVEYDRATGVRRNEIEIVL